MNWKKIFYDRLFLGILTTFLTALATTAAVISAVYPIIQDNLKENIRKSVIIYQKELNDYERVMDLFNQMETNARTLIVMRPLVQGMKDELENMATESGTLSSHRVKMIIKSFDKEIDNRATQISTQPVESIPEGRYLDRNSRGMIKQILASYKLVVVLCATEAEKTITYREFLKGLYGDKTPMELIFGNNAPRMPRKFSAILNGAVNRVKIGKACLNEYKSFYKNTQSARGYLNHYIRSIPNDK